MGGLPVNNFEEQLSRFSASKRSNSFSSNVSNNRQFTFKKPLSLGKQDGRFNLHVINKSTDKNTEEKRISSHLNEVSGSHSAGIPSNISKPRSCTVNGNAGAVKDIRSYFSNGDKKDFVSNTHSDCKVKEARGPVYNIPSENNVSPVCNIPTKSETKPLNCYASLTNKVNTFVSDENAENKCKSPKESPPVSNTFKNLKNHVHDKENHLSIEKDNTDSEELYSSSSNLSSLKEANYKLMTKICDLIENQAAILALNNTVKQLLSARRKILNKFSSDGNGLHTTPVFSQNKNEAMNHNTSPKVLKKLPLFNSSPNFNSLENEFFDCKNSDVKNQSTEECSPEVKHVVPGNKNVTSWRGEAPQNELTDESPKEIPHALDNSVEIDFEELIGDFTDEEKEFQVIPSPSLNMRNKSFGASSSKTETKNCSFSNGSASENKSYSAVAGKFYGCQRDDGALSDFKGLNFPFSKDVMSVFQNMFGLKKFRHNQLEAINAALLKEDCFVLMPTGGGKSLCYQLPALVTGGVTLVISPLRSLIMDQVQKLCSLDIPASSLTGDTDSATVNYVYAQLSSREPGIKLLYVTPEKISASQKLIQFLDNLYSRNMIQRFVIDEAHCVSQWGHDFRPDYKKLKVLREKFPNVPIMALTATATQRVRGDILLQLGMKSPKWFLQSFNRPNLKYEVRQKTKGILSDITDLLKTKFKNMCGIVYCLSRNDCDTVADHLKKNGIKAASYHAGLNNRDEIQEMWINDQFKVICATIAFGMGIDKPDVRFVIHHALPKSIEGYYQESGRAGRDGEVSWCILFYSYKDMQRIKRMITQDDANKHSWSTHFDNLFKMVHYCENKTDCRRVWMLGYFGEIFDKNLCLKNSQTSCDNCYSKEVFIEHDVTEDAKNVIMCVAKLVDKNKRKNYTLTYFVDIYKGAKTQKILAAGHDKLPLHGKGHHLRRSDAERLLRKLVLDQYLQEDTVHNKMDLPISYIYLGRRAKELLNGNAKVTMSFQKDKNKPSVGSTSTIVEEDKEIKELSEKCYNELIEVSKNIAAERNIHYANVINIEALRQMSREMPMAEEEMFAIPHVTHAFFEKYGKRFLEVTEKYAAERCVIEAERADKNIFSAFNEEIEEWSDPESAPKARKGVKRRASRDVSTKAKRIKGFFAKKKFMKAKGKSTRSTYLKKGKKMTATQPQRTLGSMPNPKPKPAARSFLPTPKMVFS